MLSNCSNPKNKDNFGRLKVTKSPFGKLSEGIGIDQFTLQNEKGMQVEVLTYGGIVRRVSVPDREGQFEDVVLGYDSLNGYLEQSPYFGAIVGRYGNRITKGKFSLDGTVHTLATNNDPNHLHGGVKGYDKVVWDAEPFIEADKVGVRLVYTSADGEEGYPGEVTNTVTYTLNNENTLRIDYYATTDARTIINLTNHSYFNFNGAKDDILSHRLRINASKYLPVDSTLIPGQPAPVKGTPFDFTDLKPVGYDIEKSHVQLKNGLGYDHCWILNKRVGTDQLTYAASLHDPGSGRFMEVYTTEPGIQFYSGNFLDGSIQGKSGTVYGYRSGLCLETQHFPDSPNRPDFPSVVLDPEQPYRSTTLFKFSIK